MIFSFDLYTYIGLKGLNRFKIYRYDFSQLLIFCFFRLFSRFVSPLCLPPVWTGPASLTDEPAGSKSSGPRGNKNGKQQRKVKKSKNISIIFIYKIALK